MIQSEEDTAQPGKPDEEQGLIKVRAENSLGYMPVRGEQPK